jgi:DNA modification methylase
VRVNKLYYGDNLDVLRESIADESVDLIYLDPPFNSNANYNVLFKSKTGEGADAQITAFEDTWHWNDKAEDAFDQVMRSGLSGASELLRAMRGFLGENDMMAYLAMMAIRLIELHRVLKATGSLYLHCDPTASHYLKLLLDGVFGGENFQNEIVWSYRRWPTTAKRFQRMHDTILFYSKRDGQQTFHVALEPPTASSLKRWKGKKQTVTFNELGERNPTIENEEDSAGVAMNAVWSIPIIAPVSKERLGYPTQKPLALLERIIAASSNEGEVVLDPFCGCGTAVHAAQKLGRRWIGIDVTHLAIHLIEKRLNDAFPGIQYEVHGTPRDLASAQDLAERDKHQFELWALAQVDAVPWKGGRKGADTGIDGIIYFKPDGKRTEKAIVEVKGGGTGVKDIGRLAQVMEREKAELGVLVTAQLPTSAMVKDAAAVGRFTDDWGRAYPKLQILTLAEMFQGKKPDIPFADPSSIKRAKREDEAARKQGSLL